MISRKKLRKLREAYIASLQNRMKQGMRLPQVPELSLGSALEASSGMPASTYVSEMSKDSSWGGYFECAFLAWKFNVPFPGFD